MTPILRKNIFLFYIQRGLSLPFFWLPILYFYLVENKGFSPSSTLLLLSIQEFLLIFLEVPTGVIADKVSRKLSIIIGNILYSIPFAFLPWANDLWIFVLIFTVKAVGKAFISGADSSLLYDRLLQEKYQKQYKNIIQKSRAILMGVTAICVFAGGYIADYNIELTFFLTLPLSTIAVIAVMFMDEPELSKAAKKLQDSNYITHTITAIKHIFLSKSLLIASIVFMIIDGLAVNMKWFYAPILGEFNLSFSTIGVITGFIYATKSLGGLLSQFLMFESNKKNVILNLFLTSITFITAILIFKLPIVVVSLFLIIYFEGVITASIGENINEQVESKNRATVISLISMFGSIVATVMLNGFGFVSESSGVRIALLFLSSFLIIAWLISYQLKETSVPSNK